LRIDGRIDVINVRAYVTIAALCVNETPAAARLSNSRPADWRPHGCVTRCTVPRAKAAYQDCCVMCRLVGVTEAGIYIPSSRSAAHCEQVRENSGIESTNHCPASASRSFSPYPIVTRPGY